MPLDVHVLRRRYNGKELKSTYAVGREMGISDELVRKIENRALEFLSHCVDLEANGQEITPMRLAKSIKQPVASLICEGLWRSTSCAGYTAHRGELLIVASHRAMDLPEFERHVKEKRWYKPQMTAYPRGAIVGRVLLINCFKMPIPHPHPHKGMLLFEQPETFPEPIPYAGQRAYFYVNPKIAQQLPPRYPFSF
jgi:hypothetical protein